MTRDDDAAEREIAMLLLRALSLAQGDEVKLRVFLRDIIEPLRRIESETR